MLLRRRRTTAARTAAGSSTASTAWRTGGGTPLLVVEGGADSDCGFAELAGVVAVCYFVTISSCFYCLLLVAAGQSLGRCSWPGDGYEPADSAAPSTASSSPAA